MQLSNTANTWGQVTITFTPTEKGVAEIERPWAYYVSATAGAVYVDDASITQEA